MWQLHHIEKDVTRTNEDLEAERKSREGVIHELENFEHEASKKKKEQAKYLKEIAQCERKIAERSNKLDKSVSFYTFYTVLISMAVHWIPSESSIAQNNNEV